MESTEVVRERIATAFAEFELPPAIVGDIAFHLTDWKEDLEAIIRIYEQPQMLSDEQVQRLIIRFLAHVPNHLAAAKKLLGLGPIEDVFEVGVLTEDR